MSLLTLVLALVLGLSTFSNINGFIVLKETEDSVKQLREDFAALQALYHGDACSHHAHHKYVRQLDASNKDQAVQAQELMNELVLGGELHCNYQELLVCNKRKQKCMCGNVWEEALGTPGNKAYLREGQVCRLGLNGVCSSGRNLCAKGTTCVLDSDYNLRCTKENEQRPEDSEESSEESWWDWDSDWRQKHAAREGPSAQSCSCQYSPSVFGQVRSQAGSRYQLKELSDELQYGDKCSPHAEELRIELYRTHLKADYDTGDMTEELWKEFEEKWNALVANGEPLCSTDTLICNTRTKTCDCGDSVYKALGIQAPEFIFEGSNCRIAKGNACLAVPACTTGTACLGAKNSEDCHIAAKEYGNELLVASPNVTSAQWMKGVLDGRVCTCQTVVPEAEPSRWKRGTNASASVGVSSD